MATTSLLLTVKCETTIQMAKAVMVTGLHKLLQSTKHSTERTNRYLRSAASSPSMWEALRKIHKK